MTRNDNRRRHRFHPVLPFVRPSLVAIIPTVQSRGTTTGRKVGHKDRSLSRKRQKRQEEQQQLGPGSGGRWWRGIRREGVTQSARKKEGGRVIKHFSSTISLVDLLQFSRRRERNGFYKHAHKRGRETLLVYNHHPPSSVIVTGRVKRDFSSPLPLLTPTMELYGAERSQRGRKRA